MNARPALGTALAFVLAAALAGRAAAAPSRRHAPAKTNPAGATAPSPGAAGPSPVAAALAPGAAVWAADAAPSGEIVRVASPTGAPVAPSAAPSPVAAAPAAWPLASSGVSLALAAPPAARDLADEQLPPVDLSGVPGGTLALRRGIAWGATEAEGRLVAVCLGVDGRSWSDGAEALFFGRLNAAAKVELERRGEVENYEERPTAGDGNQFLQRYSASVKEGGERGRLRPLEAGAPRPNALRAEGVHAIVFAGARPDVIACSVACVEAEAAAAPRCAPALESLRLEGPLVAPPRPGVGARALGFLGRHPLASVGLGFGGLLMALGLLAAVVGGQKKSAQAGPNS